MRYQTVCVCCSLAVLWPGRGCGPVHAAGPEAGDRGLRPGRPGQSGMDAPLPGRIRGKHR
jgi:hypothetical protein